MTRLGLTGIGTVAKKSYNKNKYFTRQSDTRVAKRDRGDFYFEINGLYVTENMN